MTVRNLGKLFILLLGASLAACGTLVSNPPSTPSVQLDERLRRIKMTDADGRPFTLQKMAGRPVFLNFWAAWCGPCVSEMASIQEAHAVYGEEVTFLAVSTERLETIRAFQEKHGLTFQFARLDVEYLDAFVVKLPTTLLISRDGKLVAEEEGARVWTLYNNMEKIRKLAE